MAQVSTRAGRQCQPSRHDYLRSCDDANVGLEEGPRATAVAVAAHVRVYEPLTAFPAAQRARLLTIARAIEQSAAAAGAGSAFDGGADRADHELTAHVATVAEEHRAAIRAAMALPPRMVSDSDLRGIAAVLVLPASLARRAGADAGVGADAGAGAGATSAASLVCPLDLGWRTLLAVDDLRETLPPESLRAVLPTAVVDAAAERLAQVAASARRAGPHVRSSRWHVPMAWLTAFGPDQVVVEGSTADGGAAADPGWGESTRDGADVDPAAERAGAESPDRPDAERCPSVRSSDPSAAPIGVRYVAPMADARRGVARALAVLRRTPSEVLTLGELEEFGRWLEEFHPRSVVELDCTGLAGVAGAAWAAQQSVAEVAGALADLRAGRPEAGARTLRGVRARWAAVQAFEHAS